MAFPLRLPFIVFPDVSHLTQRSGWPVQVLDAGDKLPGFEELVKVVDSKVGEMTTAVAMNKDTLKICLDAIDTVTALVGLGLDGLDHRQIPCSLELLLYSSLTDPL